jgi:hypothetical protein
VPADTKVAGVPARHTVPAEPRTSRTSARSPKSAPKLRTSVRSGTKTPSANSSRKPRTSVRRSTQTPAKRARKKRG